MEKLKLEKSSDFLFIKNSAGEYKLDITQSCHIGELIGEVMFYRKRLEYYDVDDMAVYGLVCNADKVFDQLILAGFEIDTTDLLEEYTQKRKEFEELNEKIYIEKRKENYENSWAVKEIDNARDKLSDIDGLSISSTPFDKYVAKTESYHAVQLKVSYKGVDTYVDKEYSNRTQMRYVVWGGFTNWRKTSYTSLTSAIKGIVNKIDLKEKIKNEQTSYENRKKDLKKQEAQELSSLLGIPVVVTQKTVNQNPYQNRRPNNVIEYYFAVKRHDVDEESFDKFVNIKKINDKFSVGNINNLTLEKAKYILLTIIS